MNEPSIITTIEQQKNKRRYNIYINEVYSFSVHEDILIKYRLAKGKVFEPKEWEEILAAEEKNRLKQYAFAYLNFRPRTAVELLNYLISKGFTQDDCREVVEACISSGYVNDDAFAGQWIELRKRSRPRGRKLLKFELLNKGIEEATIDAQLEQLISHQDEEEMITALIRKKLKDSKFDSSYELKKKIVPYLQRKGFNLDIIMHVVEKVKNRYLTR